MEIITGDIFYNICQRLRIIAFLLLTSPLTTSRTQTLLSRMPLLCSGPAPPWYSQWLHTALSLTTGGFSQGVWKMLDLVAHRHGSLRYAV